MPSPQIILGPGMLNDADLARDQTQRLPAVRRPMVAEITLADLAQDVLAIAEARFVLVGFVLGEEA